MNIKRVITAIIIVTTILSCGGNAVDQESVVSDTDTMQQQVSVAAEDTVNNPRLVMAGADGAYLLTAETGKPVGPDIKYMPEWRAFGWFRSDDRVEWETDIAKEGEYDVYLEWSVSDEESGKTFLMEAGKEQLTGTVAKSGSWETFKNEKIGRINLKQGKQQIVFRSKSKFGKDGALLDLRQLKLVPVK